MNEDPLNYTENNFDIVIAFPPFGHRVEIAGKRTFIEILYVEKVLNLINNEGTAILILPNNFLTAPHYSDIRNFILEKFRLTRLFALPQGIIRNMGIELSILEIKKTATLNTDFYIVNTGFDLKVSKPSFTIKKDDFDG